MINRAYHYGPEGLTVNERRDTNMRRVVAAGIIIVGAIMATDLHSPYPFLAGLVLAAMAAYRGE